MKTKHTKFLASLLLLTTIILVFACKKNKDTKIEEPVKQDENPVPAFYDKGGFNASVTAMFGQPNYELGLSFKPLTYGILKTVSIKLPANLNRNRITLWDKATGAILFTWRVPILTDTSPKNECIISLETPFALTQNKEYILSMNASDWYVHRVKKFTTAVYPITVGSIQFLDYLESANSTTNQEIPSVIITDYVIGNLGFTFQPL